MFIKRRLRRIILFNILDRIIFKEKDKIVFVIKDKALFSGNIKQILYEISSKFNNDKKIYVYSENEYLLSEEEVHLFNKYNIVFINRYCIRAMYHILSAGLIILSHSIRDAYITRKDRNRIVLNVWHGVPFKSIELAMENITDTRYKLIKNNAKLYDLFIANSYIDKLAMSSVFGVDYQKVLLTGLPRMDQYCDISANKKNINQFILYAPTFRESNKSPLEQISIKEWKLIEEFCKNNNYIFGVRPHYYDVGSIPFTSDIIINCDKNIYPDEQTLLNKVDILITDYSSIWIDFLLLNKPIIHFAKDIEHYRINERGFIYDFEKFTPNIFINNINSLIEAIKKQPNGIEYIFQKKIFHTFNDSNNTQRLIEILKHKGVL